VRPRLDSRAENQHNGDTDRSQRRGLLAQEQTELQHTTNVSPEAEVAISRDLAEDGLFRFFKDGIASSSWNVFDQWDKMRVAYIGTQTSNMSQLIRLNRPCPPFLIYPYPPIHPPLPWKPEAGNDSRSNVHDLLQDVNSFPAKDVRDDFVEAFFEKIHPCFPIIDESDFRARYSNPQNQPPLLLLHAVLLAGAHVSVHPKAVQARHMVKAALFRRAKYVFDIRHENDRLNLVQAALLFTWHLQNGDTASSNSYFWSGVACRIAFGIGMHRDLMKDPPNRMPLSDRRLWRRVWWTLFQVEIMSALEHGRPPMIHLDDFDQGPLRVDDFREMNGAVNTKLDYEYCSRNIDLCYMALAVTRLGSPGTLQDGLREQSVTSLNARLVAWILDIGSKDTFGALNIRLHYHNVVIHLHRIWIDAASDTSSCGESTQVCSGAASAIVSNFETTHARHMTGQYHFTAVTALTAAAIHVSKDIQRALSNNYSMLAVSNIHLLDRICSAADHLSEYWPSAEGVRKLFKSLCDKFTGLVTGMQSGQLQTKATIEDQLSHVNWTDILGYPWEVGYSDGQNWDATLFGPDP
jgi:transcriptional regulatory protein AMDR